MLEQSSLLLKPWLYTEGPKTQRPREGWARAIVQPTTLQTLGYAAWDDAGIPKVLYYLGRRRIQVFESEDESLLMTLYRPWGISRMWSVLDAEERLVGRLFRDVLCDGYGATVGHDGPRRFRLAMARRAKRCSWKLARAMRSRLLFPFRSGAGAKSVRAHDSARRSPGAATVAGGCLGTGATGCVTRRHGIDKVTKFFTRSPCHRVTVSPCHLQLPGHLVIARSSSPCRPASPSLPSGNTWSPTCRLKRSSSGWWLTK